MADNETVVRGVKWGHVLSIGHVTRAFRIAIWPPSKLILCLLALVITIGSGVVLDQMFNTKVKVGAGRLAVEKSYCDNLKDVYYTVVGQSQTQADVAAAFRAFGSGKSLVVETTPPLPVQCVTYAGGPVKGLLHLLRMISAYWSQAFWFAVVNSIIAIAVWAFFGGAVCRIAAVQFARDERIGICEAVGFACKRYTSLVASPLTLFAVICIMAIPVFAVASGVLMIPFVGEFAVALLFFMALILGVVLTLLLVFGVSSLGLQMPAIGAEGRDAFDAVSRGVGYVLARPWKYILYSLFSLVYMSLTFLLVRLFAFLVLKVPYAFMKMWPWFGDPDKGESKLARVWEEPTMNQLFAMPAATGTEYVSAVIIGIFIFILLGMMVAFIPSFLLSSQTIIYFLLRRMIDFKDLDEVYIEGDESETGLTRLEKTEDQAIEPEPPAAADDVAGDAPPGQ